MDCGICSDKFVVNSKTVTCGFCENKFHSVCARIKDAASKLVNDMENLIWYCDECIQVVKQNLKMMENLINIKKSAEAAEKRSEQCFKVLEDIKTKITISIQENPLKTRDVMQRETKTYAGALREGVIIVKPKNVDESKNTEQTLHQHMDPANLGVGIRSIRSVKEGAVVICCRNDEEAKKLKSNIEHEVGENYSISVPSKKRPCIKMVGIGKEYTHDELINNLRRQNQGIVSEESHFLVKVVKKMVNKYMAIVECDTKTFHNVMDRAEGRLYIGYDACRCYEYVNIMRCYNCCGFKHSAKECKHGKVCGRCADGKHETKDCKSDFLQCANCKSSNEKYKLGLDVKHSIFSLDCPTYLHLVKRERAKINYVETQK